MATKKTPRYYDFMAAATQHPKRPAMPQFLFTCEYIVKAEDLENPSVLDALSLLRDVGCFTVIDVKLVPAGSKRRL